mmetsp:Transcript_101248/g.294837  ORF Transcript_101248/g.294837 Transcript_101248/m.294837 type:complete len:209 (+) Transcript_101248:1081-1707(+)
MRGRAPHGRRGGLDVHGRPPHGGRARGAGLRHQPDARRGAGAAGGQGRHCQDAAGEGPERQDRRRRHGRRRRERRAGAGRGRPRRGHWRRPQRDRGRGGHRARALRPPGPGGLLRARAPDAADHLVELPLGLRLQRLRAACGRGRLLALPRAHDAADRGVPDAELLALRGAVLADAEELHVYYRQVELRGVRPAHVQASRPAPPTHEG